MSRTGILRNAVVAVAVLALGPLSQASGPVISDISDPIQYDANNYYAYARFSLGTTWDQANVLAGNLAPFNGLPAQLATFPTDAQYNWFVTQEMNFTSPAIGEWDMAWIGASHIEGTTYGWINGAGTIPTLAPQWLAGDPITTNHGTVWQLGLYGDKWTTLPAADASIGNVIIQYTGVPEPTTALVLGGGLLVLASRRRARKS